MKSFSVAVNSWEQSQTHIDLAKIIMMIHDDRVWGVKNNNESKITVL